MSVVVELSLDDVITQSPNVSHIVNMANMQYHAPVIVNFYITKWFEYRLANSNDFTNTLSSCDAVTNIIKLIMVDEEERGTLTKTFPVNIGLNVLTNLLLDIHKFYGGYMETVYLSAMTSINNLLSNVKTMWIIKNMYEIKTQIHNGQLLIYVKYE